MLQAISAGMVTMYLVLSEHVCQSLQYRISRHLLSISLFRSLSPSLSFPLLPHPPPTSRQSTRIPQNLKAQAQCRASARRSSRSSHKKTTEVHCCAVDRRLRGSAAGMFQGSVIAQSGYQSADRSVQLVFIPTTLTTVFVAFRNSAACSQTGILSMQPSASCFLL